MSASLLVDFDLPPSTARRLGAALWFRLKGIYLAPIPLLAVLAWQSSPSSPFGRVLTIATIAAAVGALLGVARWQANVRAILAPFAGRRVRLELTADGISSRIGDETAASSWTEVSEARVLGDFVILVMPDKTPSCLPIPVDEAGRASLSDFLARAKITLR